MDDSEGRILEVTQKSPDADLVVTVGWQVDSYSAIVRQETRIAKNGAMTVGYDFEFDWSFFEGLKKAAGLSRDNDAERLMMRLAALIQNSGQYATGSAGSFVFERSERVTQYRSTEETFRIGLPHQPGASVVYRRSSHSQKLTIQLMPTRGSHKPFPLKPPLLEQLWNPVYARALTRIFGNPPSA
jgi:hypothetical protein